MNRTDLNPLYRSIVGFDRISSLIDQATKLDSQSAGYPPYNVIDAGEDTYRIELAVAGFSEDDLDIEVREGTLFIKGVKAVGEKTDETVTERYLHRGIAERGFERRFQLADYVVVSGAGLANGMLTIELRRELPEAMKPRKISINGAGEKSVKLIDGGKAA